jgi:hypothetical protein
MVRGIALGTKNLKIYMRSFHKDPYSYLLQHREARMKAFYSEKGSSKVLRNSVNFIIFTVLNTENSKLNIPVYKRQANEKSFH